MKTFLISVIVSVQGGFVVGERHQEFPAGTTVEQCETAMEVQLKSAGLLVLDVQCVEPDE